MKSYHPLISIIVPIYNVEQYIHFCLDSLKNQTYPNLEIFLIDDGSTDNSGKICDSYSLSDSRFHIIHQENKGVSEARNTGLRRACGEYIYFVDGDDFIIPTAIEVLYNAIIKSKASFSMGLYKTIYAPGTHTHSLSTKPSEIQILDKDCLVYGLFGESSNAILYQSVWNKLYPKALIQDISFKNIVSEDTDFNIYVFLKAAKAVLVKVKLYGYVQRRDSITHLDANERFQLARSRFIYNIDTLYNIHMNILQRQKEEYRAWCLWKLYKKIFNVRYLARYTGFREEAERLIQEVANKTLAEVRKNESLSIRKKLIIFIMYNCPFVYSMMMWILKQK